jgi:hypothetical protein
MTSDNLAAALLVFWLLYWVFRFALLEVLTVVFRHVPPIRAWFRRQTEKGRFDRSLRSSELFQRGLQTLGRSARWIVGRGWLRAPTFIFVATILIFLSALPIDQARTARVEYEAGLTSIRTTNPAQTAIGLCLLENAMAEASRRTGLSTAPPTGRKLYPFDADTAALLDELRGERLIFMARALIDGRALTDDPADVDPIIRSFPALERALQAQIVDGRLTEEGFLFLPPDEASRAAREEIVAICDDDPETRSRRLTPVRDPATYLGMVERFRTRSLAFLSDPVVREAFDDYQLQVAASRFGIAFFFAAATAVVLWISMKLMIAVCVVPRRSIWLILNYGLILLLSIAGVAAVSSTLLGVRGAVNTTVPFVSGYLVASAADPAREVAYQGQINAVLGKGIALTDETCADLGENSPMSGWCKTAELLKEPWDPESQRFAFQKVVPLDDERTALTSHLLERLARSPTTFVIAYQGVDQETQDRLDISIWQGVHMGSFAALVLAPWMVLLVLATLLAPLLELRWTVVKRVDRVVREGSRRK